MRTSHAASVVELASPIERHMTELHQRYIDVRDGHVATYIPELSRVDPDLFGIAIAIVDGHVYEVGDSRHPFTIQSVSKPFVYGLALQDHGQDTLLRRVGVEPTGDPFNAIVLDEEHNRPPNPMVNAGAIAVTALIEGEGPAQRWERIHGVLNRFAGRVLDVDEAVARSEAETGHRNRAIAHLMRGFGMVRPEVEEVLNLYFRQCAVLVDASDLALMGATLAAGGLNPRTGERVLTPEEITPLLSVMSSCGMYDFSGEWIYRVGLPAKSGVGGGIVAVLPGQAGVGIFSPRLDANGNSARGVRVCEDLSRELGMHLFKDPVRPINTLRSVYDRHQAASRHVRVASDEELLRHHGGEILIVELQGQLVFGSVERLCREVTNRLAEIRDVVLDFRRVSGIDRATTRLMIELARQCGEAGVSIGLSAPPAAGLLASGLVDVLGEHPETAPASFADLDSALEAAEEHLLVRHGSGRTSRPVSLAEMELCSGLDVDDLHALADLLKPIRFRAGDEVARPGHVSSSAWFILAGSMTVRAPGPDSKPGARLRTVGPGSILGEMGLLSGAARSGWIHADTDLQCLELSPESLATFTESRPLGAATLLRNIACLLGRWLRQANSSPGDALPLEHAAPMVG
jgi:glutaminase